MIDFKGKRVTVMGLGSFGGQVAAVRFLVGQGAREIVVTDLKGADELADAAAEVRDLPGVVLKLGRHDEADFVAADAIVASPAVPPAAPLLEKARAAGVPVTSEMNLFFERCRAPIVGITGSVGKSTTTAMIHAAVAADPPGGGAVRLGGNIGHRALLPIVETIAPADTVILELSSFQLEVIDAVARSPQVAVVTNVAPNHLDRHKTMAAYIAAKRNILRFQRPADTAILNGEDAEVAAWARLTPARTVLYKADDAAGLKLRVPGRHNRSNAAAALAVAAALGCDAGKAAAALEGFAALPHRLQLVREAGGIAYYNDSKSTTPEAALTALAAFEGKGVVVIVGGYDKKIDLEPLCRELARRAKAVVAIGQTRSLFCELIKRHAPAAGGPAVKMATDLAGAVRLATHFAAPGDVVLLSPASASYDMFTNYEDRGDQFAELVGRLF
ncbi:MAG: UDP-N-acetylmuramoylalanine--D-glutamate ligase [Phycisphaerae bacterium]|nr:UDP-N-acetylmuramoylalanine--D-glutamate ligase [Phycisphaerae bacterium]